MCQHTNFQQNRPNNFGDIAIYGFLRWPPLGFSYFDILVVRKPNMHRCAKFYQNRSNSCGNIAFNVFNMVTVRQLGFLKN